MSQTIDSEFRKGDSITFEVANKPYSDLSVPPESNDFLWADQAIIRIYSPKKNFPRPIPDDDWDLVVETPLYINESKVGFYWYRFATDADSPAGLWKVEFELTTCLPVGVPSSTSPCVTSTEVSSASGSSSDTEPCVAKSIGYFRLSDMRVR